MAELYFVDTVKCQLGKSSNCVMKDKLRLGPQCAKCGFNANVHGRRVAKVREEGLTEFDNGLQGLKI